MQIKSKKLIAQRRPWLIPTIENPYIATQMFLLNFFYSFCSFIETALSNTVSQVRRKHSSSSYTYLTSLGEN